MYANWSTNLAEEDVSHKNVSKIIEIITSLRSFKNELGVPPGSFVEISLDKTNKDEHKFYDENQVILKKLGRINNIYTSGVQKSYASLIVNGELLKIYFDQDINLEKIKENLLNKQQKIKVEMDKINSRITNKNFIDKAPNEIVEQEKTNFNNLEKDAKKIQLTLESL